MTSCLFCATIVFSWLGKYLESSRTPTDVVARLHILRRKTMRVDMNNTARFVSLEEIGLEESSQDEPMHGVHYSADGSIYYYANWFYDGDESAFELH